MSYPKPDGLLLNKPVSRRTPKSAFLRKLEREQKLKAEQRNWPKLIHTERALKSVK